MKNIVRISLLLIALFFSGCDKDALLPADYELRSELDQAESKNNDKLLKATGDVLVTYLANPGGHNDNGENGNEEAEGKTRFAQVEFNAIEGNLDKPAKGELTIVIKNENGEVKREFKASVYEVEVEPELNQAWFIALVDSDIRSDGGDHGGDDGHDQTDSGSGQDNHDDESHEEEDHEGGGCSGGDDHGNKSRVGDSILVRVLDGGTPGTNGDQMRWKWLMGNHSDSHADHGGPQWEDMCNKEIIGGNLVVHIK